MTIKLFWWGGGNGEINFGDGLSPLLVEDLSGKKAVYSDIETCDVAAAGSVLRLLVRGHWKRLLSFHFRKIKVWGSGAIKPKLSSQAHRILDIFAVRGPHTRDLMGLPKTTPLGDPGLLVDRLVQHGAKRHRWGIIPHIHDRKLPLVRQMHNATPHSCMIDLGEPDLLETTRKIAACDFIISSSLHGLIAADALGIPNLWMSISENIIGGNWKFADYFASVRRAAHNPVHIAEDLREFENTAGLSDRGMILERQKDLEMSFKKMQL